MEQASTDHDGIHMTHLHTITSSVIGMRGGFRQIHHNQAASRTGWTGQNLMIGGFFSWEDFPAPKASHTLTTMSMLRLQRGLKLSHPHHLFGGYLRPREELRATFIDGQAGNVGYKSMSRNNMGDLEQYEGKMSD
jgi:hypothetical protein